MSPAESPAPGPIPPAEAEAIAAFQPIRQFALASCLYHLSDSGVYDDLQAHGPTSAEAIAERLGLDSRRLDEFLRYLRNEGYVDQQGMHFTLNAQGQAFGRQRDLYTFMIGGYAQSFLDIGDKLRAGAGSIQRNWTKVSIGSSNNARNDTPPILQKLLSHLPIERFQLLDISCGNGGYLIDLCQALPQIEQAYGVDPSQESREAARALIRAHGLEERIRIMDCSNRELLDNTVTNDAQTITPNLLILGYVLHERLASEGREGIKRLLCRLTECFPDLNLIVMEIDDQRDTPEFLAHDYGLAFYNPYFLLHGFSNQQVMPASFWEALFAECALAIVAKESIDSTGWLPCYLLRRA